MYTLEQSWEILDYRRCRFWQKKILFSEESHFDLGGYLNKQNCRIWGTETPQAYIEKPTHPKRVTVWCGFWFRGIFSHFSSKMNKEKPLQSIAIVIEPCWTNFCSGGYWQHLISTGRRYVPHSPIYTRCFAICFWRSYYPPQSWCRLATSKLRFNTVGLLFVGGVKDKCYARDN